MESIQIIRKEMLQEGPPAAGMTRKQVPVGKNVIVVEARNQPNSFSGWHHHGERTACVYVLKGKLRIEYGPDGKESVEADAGDFYVIQPNTIHREGNPGSEEQIIIGFKLGLGQADFNVEKPEPAVIQEVEV